MGLTTFLRRQPLKPSLDLDFLKQVYKMNLIQRAFSDVFTFTRASGGGRINASGQFEWVAANQPRFDYDPTTQNGTNGVELVAPGDNSRTLASGYNGYINGSTPILLAGLTYKVTYSYNITAGAIQFSMGGANDIALGSGQSGTRSFTFTCKAGLAGGNLCWQFFSNYAAGSVSGVSVQQVIFAPNGLPLEEPRTNLVQRSADWSTWWSANSAPTRTAAYGLAPDGTTSTTRMQTTVANSGWYAGINAASGTTITASIFVRAVSGSGALRFGCDSGTAANSGYVAYQPSTKSVTFTGADATVLGVTDFGNGMSRLVIRYTTTAATNSLVCYQHASTALDCEIWGCQLEAGSFATSYIPTSGSQVTRAADLQTEPLSPWFNQSKGTVVWSGDVAAVVSGKWLGLFSFDDGAFANRLGAYVNPNGTVAFTRRISGTSIEVVSANAVTAGTRFKVACSWDSTNLYISLNGGAVASFPHGGLPTVNRLVHGKLDDYLNGHKAGFKYQQKTTTGAALQALSA